MERYQFKILAVFIAFVFGYSCAGSSEYSEIQDAEFTDIRQIKNGSYQKTDTQVKKYKFHEKRNGDDIYLKVFVKEGEIFKLYKNNVPLEVNEVALYRNYLLDKIEEFEQNKYKQYNSHAEDKWFGPRHKIYVDAQDPDFDININLNSEEFERGMEKLGEALSNLDINVDFNLEENDWEWDDEDLDFIDSFEDCNELHIHFDRQKFQDSMEKLHENLKGIENIKINMDMDEFNDGMKDFSESMKNMKKDLSGLKENVKELKWKTKQFENFIDEISEELTYDDYLTDEDETYYLELSKDEMIINGDRLPVNLHNKYLNIYLKYYGSIPEEKIVIKH